MPDTEDLKRIADEVNKLLKLEAAREERERTHARQHEEIDRQITEHCDILHGRGKEAGLLELQRQDHEWIEGRKRFESKLLWMFLAGILTAAGGLVWNIVIVRSLLQQVGP